MRPYDQDLETEWREADVYFDTYPTEGEWVEPDHWLTDVVMFFVTMILVVGFFWYVFGW